MKNEALSFSLDLCIALLSGKQKLGCQILKEGEDLRDSVFDIIIRYADPDTLDSYSEETLQKALSLITSMQESIYNFAIENPLVKT